MKSFDFDAAAAGVSDCEGEVDLMAMINGGQSAEPVPASEPVKLDGQLPTFGDDQSTASDDDDSSDDIGDDDTVDYVDDTDSDDESASTDNGVSDIDDSMTLDEQIQFAKNEHTKTALLRFRSEAELKEIKKAEKSWLERIDKLQMRKMNRSNEVPPPAPASAPASKPEDTTSSVGDASADTNANPDAWKSIPAADILAKVKLSDKKREALLDQFQTLGQLEAAREQASRAFKHFSEMLPDGIGKTTADEIETAMIPSVK